MLFRSVADGCNAPRIGELPFETCRALESIVVSEAEVEEAFRVLYREAKLAVEPAAAVPLAALLAGRVSAQEPVVVVSGGNVDPEIASGILTRR